MRQQSAELDGDDAANQLVAAADFAEIAAARGDVTALQFCWDQAVDLRFGHAVMSAGRLGAFNFAVINPLFQRGVADAENPKTPKPQNPKTPYTLHEFIVSI